MRKAIPAMLAGVAVLSIVVGGCPTRQKVEQAKPTAVIRISGSSTCLPLVKVLAREFERKNKDVSFEFLPGVHSRGGIKGVADGDLEIGTVSRPLKPEEEDLGLTYRLLSTDGLAIGTHPSVHIRSITSDQVRGIYSGRITNWRQLGGPNHEIVVLDRNEDESAKIILRQYILGPSNKLKVTKKAIVLYYESDLFDGLLRTPYSIGYFSLGYALSEKLNINLLRLDGVEPTVKNVVSGRYKVIRPLGIVVKGDAHGAVKEFIDFSLSAEGRQIMLRNGFAPAPQKAE